MPDSATFSLFLVAALICIVMPGPAVIYVLARPRIMDGLRWLFASLFLALGLRLALAGRD